MIARRFPIPAAALLALVAGAGPALADEPGEPAPPPFESEGELAFFVDLAAFRGEEGRTEQEIYLSITNDELALRPAEDGVWRGDLLLEIRLRAPDGAEALVRETELEPVAAERLDAGDRAIQQVIRERGELAPGVYHLEVVLTDRFSEKPGLLNKIRKAKNAGRVREWIEVPDRSAEGLALSDPVLVRTAEAVPGTAFGRWGIEFDPNPSRLYGLALPKLRYFVEVHAGASREEGDTFLVQSQVVDLSGVPRAERRRRAEPASGAFAVTGEIDLADVPAGSYRLDLTVVNERTRAAAHASRDLEVIWAVVSWGRDPDELLREMMLVMTDSEYETLENLSPGAREIYLAEFWHRLDPDPSSPENPLLQTFRQRVAYADREFASTLRRGILTDRGRVWVRYGPPDDVVYEFSSSGFGGLEGAGERVAEPGERAGLGARPSASFLDADEFREGDLSDVARQRGSATVKSKQLEVWTYDGRGHPLRPDRQDLSSGSHRGLKFLFADEMGNGDYQLIGSTGTSVY